MREHITHVAFDMHQASVTAAWLLPSANTPELRTFPHEPKPFRCLVKQILTRYPIGSWKWGAASSGQTR